MTIIVYILTMSKCRRIIFIAYQGVELLDIAGPSSVFSAANTISGKTFYKIVLKAPSGEPVQTCSGLVLASNSLEATRFTALDTVLVVGANKQALSRAMQNTVIHRVLRRADRVVERIGSICTGAFVLAKAGLLNGKRATTHWKGREQLSMMSDVIDVDTDALYIVDGRIWTSAGVTSGIDMAMAMVERDHGAGLKASVAKQLVVYSHRPGNQSQFSELLAAQVKAGDRYNDLIHWLRSRLDRGTKVYEMAEFLHMSERSFYRHFTKTFNQTPSKFLLNLKLDASKELLEAGQSVNVVVSKVGFLSESAFRSAFKTQFGVTPALYVQMHGDHERN